MCAGQCAHSKVAPQKSAIRAFKMNCCRSNLAQLSGEDQFFTSLVASGTRGEQRGSCHKWLSALSRRKASAQFLTKSRRLFEIWASNFEDCRDKWCGLAWHKQNLDGCSGRAGNNWLLLALSRGLRRANADCGRRRSPAIERRLYMYPEPENKRANSKVFLVQILKLLHF
jgi:hypothetical protein